MELQNRLPFPAMAFRQFDAEGGLDCIVSVRATFMHAQGGSLDIAAEQESFQWEDAYEGDAHQTVLLRQSDLTPDKPGTDITFLGNAWSASGEPEKSSACLHPRWRNFQANRGFRQTLLAACR